MSLKYFEQLSSAYMAHFCRRLSDLIIEQGTELLHEMKLTTPGTAISTILYLDTYDKVTVAALADALGVSHQMATQRTNTLEKMGLVTRVALPDDKRAKSVKLTSLGKKEAKKLQPLTEELTEVFNDLESELGCALTRLIRDTELTLLKKSLKQRLKEKRSS